MRFLFLRTAFQLLTPTRGRHHQVHSLELSMIFLLRNIEGLRVGFVVFLNLARPLTGSQRTKQPEKSLIIA
jgi:hypothetical protein